MSELEVGRRAAQAISPSAIGKLRSIGGVGKLLAQTEGFDEVFAEVFAHIAQSQAVEQVESVNTGDGDIAVESQSNSDSDQDQLHQSDDDQRSDAQREVLDLVVDDQQDGGHLDVIQESGEQEVLQEVETDSGLESEVDLGVVETDQSHLDNEEVQIVAPVVEQTTQDQGDDGRDRRRGESKVQEVATGHLETKTTRDRDQGAYQQDDVAPIESNFQQDDLGQEGDQSDGSDRSRRLRGRRHADRGAAVSEANQQARPKQDQLLRAIASQNSNAQASSIVDQVDSSTLAAASKSAKAVSPQIAAVSQAAAQARASAPTGSSNNANGFQLKGTQAVDGPNSAAAANDKPKPKTAKNNAAETVSRVKLIQRVSKAFQHFGAEGGTVRLRLAPAELGSVRVEMRVQQRKVQARVVAETEAASTALREHLPELRQRLESQGMQVERLDVEVESNDRDTGDFRQQGNRDWQQSHSQSQSHRRPPTPRDNPTPTSVEVPPDVSRVSHYGIPSEGVDIRF